MYDYDMGLGCDVSLLPVCGGLNLFPLESMVCSYAFILFFTLIVSTTLSRLSNNYACLSSDTTVHSLCSCFLPPLKSPIRFKLEHSLEVGRRRADKVIFCHRLDYWQ